MEQKKVSLFTTAAGHLDFPRAAYAERQNTAKAWTRSFPALTLCLLSKAVPQSGPVTASFHPFSSQDRITVEDGVLSVPALALSDAGMYQCVAENKHAVIYFAAELMVLGRVAFVSPLSPQFIVAEAS